MEEHNFFSYSWHVDEKNKETTSIRIYGINDKNENICVCVENFTPYVYIELPISNNESIINEEAQIIADKIDEILEKSSMYSNKYSILPLQKTLVKKKKLYGAYLDDSGQRKEYPFLFCKFSNREHIKNLSYKLRKPIYISKLGKNYTLKMHEGDADEILQLTCIRNIPTSGWIKFFGKRKYDYDKLTLCDHEYNVGWKNLHPIDSDKIASPKIMGFDIEVNSTNPSAMPNSGKSGDKVFQISCVFYRFGDSQDKYKKYLLTLGDPNQNKVGKDVIIEKFKIEAQLLEGFSELICRENPNLIAGYNILGFDIPYMIERAKLNLCFDTFDKQGFTKYEHGIEKTIKWSSSAYKNQEFRYLDCEGRVYVDLLPLVKRDFKFSNYKLKTISEYFIGESKDPLSAKGIFKCYRIGIQKNENGVYTNDARKAMGIVGKYCVQDSALVCLLLDKLQTWLGLTEMAKTCNVPIFSLYTQGQQIKVFSQLYKYCMYQNIVVEKDGYKVTDDERYVGAHVFPPVPGKYKRVVPFDFASLYPTTIIAYNIDYYTWVPNDSNIPDKKCYVMEWEDHIGCEHDPKVIRKMTLSKYINGVEEEIKTLRNKRNKTLNKIHKSELMKQINKKIEEKKPYVRERAEINKTKPKFPMCAKRYYRFLKEPKGVLPTVIQNLLDARKHTRKVDIINTENKIKELENENKEDNKEKIKELKNLINVLEKRQLAYKVSANSMYGAMGVRKGYLPFMPGAMCTTYMGRKNIELTADTIVKEFNGELVYGDTDSNYINFPNMENKSDKELWEYSEYVAENVSKLFPPPMKLEFEGEIYTFFFILTKKRYMYRKVVKKDNQLIYSDNIGKKGVLLARRDNSKFVRDIYEGVINRIADDMNRNEILFWVLQQINIMFSSSKPHTDFVITKSVGDSGDCNPVSFVNEKGETKAKIGDYTTPLLSNKKEERDEQKRKKNATTDREFYLFCLPAQVQLAERIRRRGQRVDANSRLEYVVTNPEYHNGKQYEKIENLDYYIKFSHIVKIDYFYYLKALSNPLDQVLNVAYGKDKDWKEDFILNQYNFRLKCHYACLKELKKLFRPKLKFIEE